MRAGDLLLPTEVTNADGSTWDTDPIWRARLANLLAGRASLHLGLQYTSDKVVPTRSGKAELAATGALAVDMESAAIAAVAKRAGVPFVVVRAVCDDAHRSLPRSALLAIDATGRFRPGPFLGVILRRPIELLALLELRRDLRAALDTLRRVVAIAGRGLARTP